MSRPNERAEAEGSSFWKITGAGVAFQAGSSAVDSATIVASLVYQLTGNVFAVGAASAILRLGWLLPQVVVGFLAERASRRMPYYIAGAFGRASCLGLIAVLLAVGAGLPRGWVGGSFLVLWTVYAFVSGIVAVPYNDIVGRSIPSQLRSRMLAIRFLGGGVLSLGVAAIIHRVLATEEFAMAYALIFALASLLMLASSMTFVSAGEPQMGKATTLPSATFVEFLRGGCIVVRSDQRFRIFLFSQWLGGAALMVLPFYVVVAAQLGLKAEDVALLLGAQTVGSLLSNAAWGHIGDRYGKVRLLEVVGILRLAPPLGLLAILAAADMEGIWRLATFAVLFVVIGALINGTTIAYLGFLMEISPDDRRPAYSAYFNVLASPAALLPILGAAIVEAVSVDTVFGVATAAAALQLILIRRLRAVKTDAA